MRGWSFSAIVHKAIRSQIHLILCLYKIFDNLTVSNYVVVFPPKLRKIFQK